MTKLRPIHVIGRIALIPLTQGYQAIIEASDVPCVDGRNWCALRRGKKVYAGRSVWVPQKNTNRVELMHRVLMGNPTQGVDHIDGNGLNNMRSNLRVASKSQNARNTGAHSDNRSGFKGVWYHAQRDRWTAAICVHGQRKYLGLFDSPEEAHAAYVDACKILHGKFARFQ